MEGLSKGMAFQGTPEGWEMIRYRERRLQSRDNTLCWGLHPEGELSCWEGCDMPLVWLEVRWGDRDLKWDWKAEGRAKSDLWPHLSSLKLILPEWGRARVEAGDWLGGFCSHPGDKQCGGGEEWTGSEQTLEGETTGLAEWLGLESQVVKVRKESRMTLRCLLWWADGQSFTERGKNRSCSMGIKFWLWLTMLYYALKNLLRR